MSGRIVFFPHPGGEHITVDPGYRFTESLKELRKQPKGIMPWNDAGKHARKFIEAVGDRIGPDGELVRQEKLLLWGEWEQESRFTKLTCAGEDCPNYVHEPVCIRTVVAAHIESGKAPDDDFEAKCREFYAAKKQNTDPYVFGDRFCYSNCRQKGQLLDLDIGDVIVFMSGFGSAKVGNRKRVMDTVFVVGGRVLPERVQYDAAAERLMPLVSPQYLCGALLPVCYGNRGSLTDGPYNVLYYGATFDAPVNGMYSYFPCKPAAENVKGFARYELFNEAAGARRGLGKLYNIRNYEIKHVEENDVFDFWNRLKEDVLRQGFCLGVKANEPSFEPPRD